MQIRAVDTRTERAIWAEYDSAADWCARRGLVPNVGDPLPQLLSATVHDLIDDDPEAFQDRVRESAYALAMSKHHA